MDEIQLLTGRVNDLSQKTFQSDFLTHTQFLSASELAAFREYVRRECAAGKGGTSLQGHLLHGVPYVVYGGWEDAERTVVVFLPSYLEEESFLAGEAADPQVIACIEVRPVNLRFAEELTHRDFLGALMHLGIERERIGDILTDAERACVFVIRENAVLVREELTKVRHTMVQCREIPPGQCTLRPAFEELQGTVSSERLDAVVAMVWHLPRGKAQELVEQELVSVDGRTAFSGGYEVKPGSRVSVRGYGKFRYLGADGRTRRGRLHVRVQVYR